MNISYQHDRSMEVYTSSLLININHVLRPLGFQNIFLGHPVVLPGGTLDWIGFTIGCGVSTAQHLVCLRGKIVGDGGDEVELVVVGGDDVSSQ